jgi:dTMP kinase
MLVDPRRLHLGQWICLRGRHLSHPRVPPAQRERIGRPGAGTVRSVPSGRLITIEGLDGAGKSTLAHGLLKALSARGLRVELLREPGGVPLSERIRELVKDPDLTVGPRAEALLYAAARAELVQTRVNDLLQDGTWVLLDRFVDSSLAYQGAGRELGMDEIRAINLFATGGLTPDRTLLLRISPRTGRQRQDVRDEAPDRLEREDEPFFAAIAKAYESLAESEPRRIRPIDAERSAPQVLEQALEELADLVSASGH